MKTHMSLQSQRRELVTQGDTKEWKKYGCVFTCCHIDNFPWYKCVIFLTKNYNLAFLLLPMHYQKDIEKLDRRNSYANHVINN